MFTTLLVAILLTGFLPDLRVRFFAVLAFLGIQDVASKHPRNFNTILIGVKTA